MGIEDYLKPIKIVHPDNWQTTVVDYLLMLQLHAGASTSLERLELYKWVKDQVAMAAWEPNAELWAAVPQGFNFMVGTPIGTLDAWEDRPAMTHAQDQWYSRSGRRWHVPKELPIGTDWRLKVWERPI